MLAGRRETRAIHSFQPTIDSIAIDHDEADVHSVEHRTEHNFIGFVFIPT